MANFPKYSLSGLIYYFCHMAIYYKKEQRPDPSTLTSTASAYWSSMAAGMNDEQLREHVAITQADEDYLLCQVFYNELERRKVAGPRVAVR